MTKPPSTDGFDCPFCAIAHGGGRPVEIVCEADHWLAFFPLEPATPGHTLVIPRAHYPDLWAVDRVLGAELMHAAIRVGRAIRTALHPDGMNLITSSGEEAEQTVFHMHLHLVPRWRSDGFGRIWPPQQTTDEAFKADTADLIRRACAETRAAECRTT